MAGKDTPTGPIHHPSQVDKSLHHMSGIVTDDWGKVTCTTCLNFRPLVHDPEREVIKGGQGTPSSPYRIEGTHSGFLTEAEKNVITQAGLLWNSLCQIVGTGPTRDADLAELIVPIHTIQRYVMAQAAARAYPDLYRLLGETLREQ